MAPHPRILFPFPTNTTECLTSCSSACLFYNLCPPPPPPPPSPPSTPIHLRHVIHLPLFLIIPSSFLILLSVLALFICFWRRNRFFNSTSTPVPALIHPGTTVTNEGDQHYVWYIRSVGLDDSAIHAISAWSYKSEDGTSTNTGTNGCAVCLGEFHEGELLRLLPKCGHAFHVPCIDTWLRAHANCPLCRAPVTAPTNSPMPPPPPSPSDDLSDEEGSNTSEGNENRDASSSRTQPVRRSISMGSMSVDCKDGNFEEGSGSKSKGEKVSLDLERSHSCSCNGFFLSR